MNTKAFALQKNLYDGRLCRLGTFDWKSTQRFEDPRTLKE